MDLQATFTGPRHNQDLSRKKSGKLPGLETPPGLPSRQAILCVNSQYLKCEMNLANLSRCFSQLLAEVSQF